jgi:hypothetical protein
MLIGSIESGDSIENRKTRSVLGFLKEEKVKSREKRKSE